MQAGYKGLVKLARNSGEYSLIDAQPVHENDTFEFAKGSDTYWIHKWDPRKERGPIYGYWAGYVLKDGGRNFEFMSVSEIEAHRDQYSQGAYKKSKGQFILDGNGKKILTGPWSDSPDWMYRKTPLIQSLKLAPKSYQLRTAMTLNDQADAGLAQTFVDIPKEIAAVPMDEPAGDEIPEPQPKAETKPDPAAEKAGKPATEGVILISDVQARRLEQIAEDSGWRQKDMLAWFRKDYKIESVSDVRAVDYDRIVEMLKSAGDVSK
jgi:recombination protein RecT